MAAILFVTTSNHITPLQLRWGGGRRWGEEHLVKTYAALRKHRWWVIFGAPMLVVTLLTCTVFAFSLSDVTASKVALATPSPTLTPLPTPLLPATNQMSVALNGPGSVTQLALTTNIDAAGDIVPTTGPTEKAALGALQAWNPPMVRLHMGFIGSNPPLPEAKQGVWNFGNLDALISTLRAHKITFFLNVRHAPPWMYDSVGQLEDSEFPAFSTYMARLVGWYNKGGFTDDQGVYHASGHYGWVHAWEIWNEPKSGAEIPGPVPDRTATPWMAAYRFAALYDMTSTAMRKVDPTIITGGPALGSWPDNDYLREFVANETAPLDFFSFHFYAARSRLETDAYDLGEVTGDRFLNRLIVNRQMLNELRPGQHIPFWIDELGFNENSLDIVDPRGSSPVGYAFIADSFATAEANGVALLGQFALLGNAQLGLVDIKTLQTYRPYWLYRVLATQFPPGSTLWPVQVDRSDQLVGVASTSPDAKTLNLLVGNIQVANTNDVNGKGVPKEVRVVLLGTTEAQRLALTKAVATVWRFDAQAIATGIPTPQTVPLFKLANGQMAIEVPIGGYGVSIISIPLK